MAPPIQEITFRDFLDSAGDNVIQAWLDSFDKTTRDKVRAKLTTYLGNLKDPLAWSRHQIKKLSGTNGIWEIRFEIMNVQYRPLLFKANGGFAILVAGAIEKSGRFVPADSISTAQTRRSNAEQDFWGRTVNHDFK